MSNIYGKGLRGKATKHIRTLQPGELPPDGVEPRRYKNSGGYVRLRWRVSPTEMVECYEHRWVMGNPPAGVQVHHKNGVKDDNRPENLAIVTTAEYGAEHAKWDVDEIAKLYLSGLSLPQIQERIGVDTSVALRALERHGVARRSLSESVAASWANGRRR